MHAMLQPWLRFRDFDGRSGRTEFWLWRLSYWGGALTIAMLFVLARRHGIGIVGPGESAKPLIVLYMVIGLVPNTAINCRRLHDVGWSHRFVFLFFLPYVGVLAELLIGLMPGQRRENAYGPDPREPAPLPGERLAEVFA